MSDITTQPDRTRRRGFILSFFTALSSLFALVHYIPLGFIDLSTAGAVVLIALGLIGAVGSLLGVRIVLVIVGCALIFAGVVRLVSYGHTIGTISGGVSAGALMAGLGIAYLAIWVQARRPVHRPAAGDEKGREWYT